ncbi:MAG: inner membrane-spanning protein YciB [Pseudohongiellaceae bacterium]
MKQFIDYIPLLIFFSVWVLDERMVSIGGFERSVGGIFSAAEFLLVASIVVYGTLFIVQRRLDKFQWITLGAVVLFCIPTIIFRDVDFLKWKAPVVNWIFATVFLGTRFIGSKPAIQHMMGHAVQAPREVWLKFNNLWIVFFVVLGGVNLAVAYTLSEAAWIQFKVFGNLVITFIFIFGQLPFLMKYMPEEEPEKRDSKQSS